MRLRNEKGYALVIVLVIITITFTLALSMSGMALSARKQFNKTDELNKATDLAEMGVAHYETLLARIVTNSNIAAEAAVETKKNSNGNGNNGNNSNNGNGNGNGNKNRNAPEYDDFFYDNLEIALNNTSNRYVTQNIQGSNSYEITLISFSTIQADNTINVTFKSKGKTGNETKTLTSTVKIEKNGTLLVGDPKPNPSDYNTKYSEPIILKGDSKYLPPFPSTYFEEYIYIQGNRILTIKGNAFFKEQIKFLGTADIIVHGDAIFTVPPDFNGKAYSFCVYGNTYLVSIDGKLEEYTNFPSGKNKSCPRPLDDEWYINPDEGIDVEY